MGKFENSVILPREDYYELQAAAQTAPTTKERVAGTAQTTIVLAAVYGGFVGASWGWAKAQDWLDRRRAERMKDKFNDAHDLFTKKS